MRPLLTLILSSISCLSLADGYGLVSTPTSDIGKAIPATGYGLVPTNYERSEQVRKVKRHSAQPSTELAVSKKSASNSYVAPSATVRTANKPQVASIKKAQSAQQRYVQPVVQSRYSSQERVSRKQYDVAVSGQRDLAQIMRAPAQFASSEPQQLRKLQLATSQPSLQKLRAQVGVNSNAAAPVAKASLGKANLQGLTAKLKPNAANDFALVNSSSSPKTASLDQLRSKVQLSNQSKKALVAPQIAKGSVELKTPLNKIPKAQTEKSLSSVNLSKLKKPQAKPAESSDKSLLDSVTQAIGVVDVKPWEKAKLAEQSMKKGGAIPSLAKFSGKVFISKEASRGGQGVAGGGCGCN